MIASWLQDVSAGRDISSTLRPPDWMKDAACAGLTPAEADRYFFPEHGPSPQAAYAMCAGCPVREQCEQRAVDLDTNDGDNFIRVVGMWGGRVFSRHVARAA